MHRLLIIIRARRWPAFYLLLLLSPSLLMAASLPTGIIPLDGRPALPLKLTDSDGNKIDLKTLRGRWVMVHFWASWCGPCREEMPSIQRMAVKMKKSRLRIVLVNTSETDDAVFSFLSVAAPDLESFMDYDGQVTQKWQPRGLPASFFVDPKGGLQYLALGGRPWDSPAYVKFLRQLPATAKKAH